MKKSLILYFFLLLSFSAFGQNGPLAPTALPFLEISPDAVSSSKGETGAATDADVYAMFWNVGKLSFLPGSYGINISYVPWLASIKSGISINTVSAYRTLDKVATLGISLSYFSLGKVGIADEVGNSLGSYSPNEFSLALAYSRRLAEHGSLGFTAKFLHSDLTQGSAIVTSPSDFAVDIGYYANFSTPDESSLSYGISINNIGPKLGGATVGGSEYLPTTLHLGAQYHLNGYKKGLNFSWETTKKLVPTLPIYQKDINGNNTSTILSGRDPNQSISSAIISSFYDAPGGFSQQFKQLTWGFGLEYEFKEKLYLRTGYHYENPYFSDKRYITAGAGINVETFHLDLSYLFPTSSINPYKDTFHISLRFIIP
jgi:hypothetical protein